MALWSKKEICNIEPNTTKFVLILKLNMLLAILNLSHYQKSQNKYYDPTIQYRSLQ